MTQGDWAALELLSEIQCRRNGIDDWDRLQQRAIGMAWAREASIPYLDRRDQCAAGWLASIIADLTR